MLRMIFLPCFLIMMLCILAAKGQNIPGYNVSNYAGISGFDLQPASIADNRYKFDAVIIGGGLTAANNFLTVRSDGILRGRLWNDSVNDIKNTYLTEFKNNKRKGAILNGYLQAVSFMLSMNRNFSLAFTFQARSYTNVNNVNPELATLIYNDFDVPSLYKLRLKNDRFSVSSMTWAEYGIGFGQVISDRGSRFWKVGGRVKLLQGISAGYIYARDLTYTWESRSTLSLFQSDFGYGHSDNFELSDNGIKFNRFTANPSIGLDLGIVYEYRPDEASFFGPDAQPKPSRRDQNKYKWRVGISLVDLGRLKFRKGNLSNDFKADVRNWEVNQIQLANTPIQSFDDTIRRRFQVQNTYNTFNMALPTALSVQVDYHIYKDLYANLTGYFSPRIIQDESKVQGLNYISFAPRWDHKWFGAFLPLSVNNYGGFNTGLALRAGPLIVGTNDISPLLWKENMRGVDIHAALKVPIPYGKPGGRIKDECPDACPEPGSSIFAQKVTNFWGRIKNLFKSKKKKY